VHHLNDVNPRGAANAQLFGQAQGAIFLKMPCPAVGCGIDETRHSRGSLETNETPDGRSLKIRDALKVAHSAPWGWGL
jgi:hypothetical protein